jgi:uncharacterized protein (TIGR03000 family)
MLQRMITRIEILALAGFGLLLVGGPAHAQQGWPFAGENWGYYGGSSRSSVGSYPPSYDTGGSYSPYDYPTYGNLMPAGAGDYGPVSRGANYGTPATVASTNRPVRVNLSVPADAKIWFGGSPTNQTGTDRHFESPPLAAGQEYAYQIRVQWTQDGQDVSRTRRVIVHAGDVINLDLGASPAASLTSVSR